MLAQDVLAAAEVVVEDGARSDERFVLETEVVGDEFGIRAEGSVIDRLAECDSLRGSEQLASAAVEVHDAQIRQAAFAFVQNKMRCEGVDRSEHDVRAIGDEFFPEVWMGIVDLDRGQAKGAAAGIRADVEDTTGRVARRAGVMVGVIFLVVFARRDQAGVGVGLGSGKKAHFASRGAGDGESKKSSAARALRWSSNSSGAFSASRVRPWIGYCVPSSVRVKYR